MQFLGILNVRVADWGNLVKTDDEMRVDVCLVSGENYDLELYGHVSAV